MPLPPCTICSEEQPLLIQGDAITGDQTFVGANCLPGFMLAAAAELTKDMPAEWCQAYGEQFDAIASNDHRPAKPPATGSRKAKAAKPAPGGAEAAADAPLAMHVELDDPCPQCGGREATGSDDKLVCDGCGTVIAVVPATTG